MLKGVKRIVSEMKEGKERARAGNHWATRENDGYGTIISYGYHSTVICRVWEEERLVAFSDGGWNTVSTNRAIGSYKMAYHEYEEVPFR